MFRIMCLLAALAACDSVKSSPPTPHQPAALGGGVGRLTSTTYRLDVEIGHSFNQQRVTGTSYRIEGNAASKP